MLGLDENDVLNKKKWRSSLNYYDFDKCLTLKFYVVSEQTQTYSRIEKKNFIYIYI